MYFITTVKKITQHFFAPETLKNWGIIGDKLAHFIYKFILIIFCSKTYFFKDVRWRY